MIKPAEANKLLEKYIEILRIQEWTIDLVLLTDEVYKETHGKDFAFDTNGCTEIDEVHMTAQIFMRGELKLETFRTTLLHECVHLVTQRYDNFVRKLVDHVDSKKLKKVMSGEAMWEMEILVSRITTILKGVI